MRKYKLSFYICGPKMENGADAKILFML